MPIVNREKAGENTGVDWWAGDRGRRVGETGKPKLSGAPNSNPL
jgi:hypothetical protein